MNPPPLCRNPLARSALTALALSIAAAPSTAQSCQLATSIKPGPVGSEPSNLTADLATLYFAAGRQTVFGEELYKTDGTPAGTVLVKNIGTGSSNGRPREITICGNTVFFTAGTTATGAELYRTDGTEAGTVLLKDIRPGFASSTPRDFVCNDGRVFFAANDGVSGDELWATDGTPGGTIMVKDIRPGLVSSVPMELVSCKGQVFFTAVTDGEGRELWASDGTSAGTRLVADIAPGPGSSMATAFLTCFQGRVFFAANNLQHGFELWVSDGTTPGTFLLADLLPGLSSGAPDGFTEFRDELFFNANNGSGDELFKTDGFRVEFVADLFPGAASGDPKNFTPADDRMYFTARGPQTGIELYKTDGTQLGTFLVANVAPGVQSSDPRHLVAVGDLCYFSADHPAFLGGSGRELYVTDGFAAGTTMVKDLNPGAASSNPTELTVSCGKLFFVATEPANGPELHVIPLPGASVQHIGQGCAPFYPTMTSSTPRLGGVARLSGADGPLGHLGAIALSSRPQAPFPIGPGCFLYLDLSTLLVVGVVIPGSWTFDLGIPNNGSLQGFALPVQTIWVNQATTFPLIATNGVLLGLGR